MQTGSDSLTFKISAFTRRGAKEMRRLYERFGYIYIGESASGGFVWVEFKDPA